MNPSTEELWKTFGDRLRRFIRARVRNDHDADDVLQEAFAKIHTGLPGVNDSERLEAWVFQVTRRAVVDHFRRRSASPPAPESPDSAGTLGIASCMGPMMQKLDEPDREALQLADVEGRRQQDLAARLGLSLSGAKSRVQRARERLKETLLECCDVEVDRRGNAIGYTPRNHACSCG